MAGDNFKEISRNKKAYHDYFVIESLEAGIELLGTEVKSIRGGQINIKESWCRVINGEMIINGMHISPYEKGNIFNKDPYRSRKLLMHKREIMKYFGLQNQQGLTILPLSVYLKGSKVKVQVGLCKGKKLHDKREVDAKRDAQRQIAVALKAKNQ